MKQIKIDEWQIANVITRHGIHTNDYFSKYVRATKRTKSQQKSG